MIRVRKLIQPPPTRAAVGQNQWSQLLRRAIARAEVTKDPRLPALLAALRTNTAEKVLREMSIIFDGDLLREFPD